MKSSFYPKRTYYSDFVPIISSFKLFAESWVLQFNCDNIWNVEKCTCLGAANALLTLFLPLSRLSAAFSHPHSFWFSFPFCRRCTCTVGQNCV